MDKWRTKISQIKDGEVFVRGQKLLDLAGKHSFSDVAFLMLKGALPNDKERQMFDTILISCVEHSVAAPSAFGARTTASTGNSLNAAVASGVLNIGDFHGGAIEQAAKLMQSKLSAKEIVTNAVNNKERVAGFGHKIYKDKDPRTDVIFKKASELGWGGRFLKKAQEIEKELEAQTGKTLPLNIDGAIAAVISEMGFDWRLGKGFFILGRIPGIIAHVHEEMVNEKPYRRLDDEDVEYIGPETK